MYRSTEIKKEYITMCQHLVFLNTAKVKTKQGVSRIFYLESISMCQTQFLISELVLDQLTRMEGWVKHMMRRLQYRSHPMGMLCTHYRSLGTAWMQFDRVKYVHLICGSCAPMILTQAFY